MVVIGPVAVVHSQNTWGGLQAGILIDAIGEQYRFLSDQPLIPEGRVLVDCKALSGEKILWISRIYDNPR